jgi:hypothetical protein
MTTVYFQNKIPHKTLRNKTPEEALTGVKLKVGHFRIFGCPIHIHVPKCRVCVIFFARVVVSLLCQARRGG